MKLARPHRFFAPATLLVAFLLPGRGTAEADVPGFDPAAPVDLDRYEGSEWPDEQQVTRAFEAQNPAFDACVAAEKQRTGKTARLVGDAGMAIRLSPEGKRPLGVNATMPRQHEQRGELVRCLRKAAAGGAYPAYEGPPLVVAFEFEIDPGEEWVED